MYDCEVVLLSTHQQNEIFPGGRPREYGDGEEFFLTQIKSLFEQTVLSFKVNAHTRVCVCVGSLRGGERGHSERCWW